ncbi:MAG: NADH:ubiquinone oxidoreductase [Candidatus Altiarchaeales archaeon ex4484_96]|nr:MAG: NADH:ubiquinone oxidoreductase [Candidatus Altiarchaeales archaeon ex4484_96]
MNESDLIRDLDKEFGACAQEKRKRRVWVSVELNELIDVCRFCYGKGFRHLSTISATDYPSEGMYELTYFLWSYEDKLLVTVKTTISRDKPVIDSVTSIWGESAQIHERELHELFGVKFEGNKDLTPLFLEEWDGPPPFRRDFNWRDYVREKYYDKENEREKPYYL